MITDENLPDGWTATSADTESDELMDHDYETREYEHESGTVRVNVTEIKEPDEFDHWAYQVSSVVEAAGAGEELGPFEDLESAREAAIEYMRDYEA